MKQRLQGMVMGVLVTTLLLGTVTVFATSTRTIEVTYGVSVVVNGVRQNFASDMQPFTSSGRTFLPVRGIADALGMNVEWDESTSTVYISSSVANQAHLPQPPITPSPVPQPTPTPITDPAQTTSGYQRIFDEYSERIRTAAPNVSLMELAEIANEGVQRMAEYMFSATGVDGQMATYQSWAQKLMDVYMEYAR